MDISFKIAMLKEQEKELENLVKAFNTVIDYYKRGKTTCIMDKILEEAFTKKIPKKRSKPKKKK